MSNILAQSDPGAGAICIYLKVWFHSKRYNNVGDDERQFNAKGS